MQEMKTQVTPMLNCNCSCSCSCGCGWIPGFVFLEGSSRDGAYTTNYVTHSSY